MTQLRCDGFRFAAVSAGIKASGALDVALLACDAPATAAAVFTQNRVKAAPVLLSQAALKQSGGKLRGVVVNSGNANACTGARGMRDARRMASEAAAAVGAGARVEQVLVASTGVIGVPLPMDRLGAGIGSASVALSADGFADFARGILTTDKRPKVAQASVKLGGTAVTLIGCTKGAGMIAPNMATTLSFVATDAKIGAAPLAAALRAAVAGTFNAITVDGDTSTNDTLAVLASGAAGNKTPGAADAAKLAAALTELLDDLAHQLIGDGEGVHHVVTVRVRGAKTTDAAQKVARRIANSPLVKTAIAGGDPNWGRILCAAGNAGVPLRPERVSVWLDDVAVAKDGAVAPDFVEARAAEVMQRAAYDLVVDLGAGTAEARYLACDLSHGYVEINADYRS